MITSRKLQNETEQNKIAQNNTTQYIDLKITYRLKHFD